MTPQEIDEIQARAKDATPGPWFTGWDLDATNDPNDLGIVAFNRGGVVGSMFVCSTCHSSTIQQAIKNAEFIAHARTDVDTLIAEVSRLKEELAAVRRPEGRC